MARIRAILNAVGGAVLGAGLFVIGALVISIFSGRASDFIVLGAIGFLCAAGGATFGYINWTAWNRSFYLRVGRGGLEIAYAGFKQPMFVPREMVRVVAVDETSGPGRRFPISPDTPASRGSTAPKQGHSAPVRDPYASPFGDSAPAITELETTADEPGWAAPLKTHPGNDSTPPMNARTEYLYSVTSPRDESVVPFLRLNSEDVPNVAIVFHESVPTPRAPIGVDFPGYRAFGGGRKVPGVMILVVDSSAVQEAFGDWNVLRQVTSQDVFEKGLFRPRKVGAQLRGALVAVGIIVVWIIRKVLELDDFGLM